MVLPLGSQIIDFELLGTDGLTHSLKEFKDQPYLAVMFTCNHCPYVVASEREFVSIQDTYHENGFRFIAINSNDVQQYPSDSYANMKERANEKEFNFPYLYDETQEIAKAYGATRTPEIFLFDSERQLIYHGRINDNPKFHDRITRHDLSTALSEIVKGEDISIPQTQPLGCTIKWKDSSG